MGALEIKINGVSKGIISNEGGKYIEPKSGAIVVYDGDYVSLGTVNGNSFHVGSFGSYAGPFEINERFVRPIEKGEDPTRMVDRVLVTKVRG